MAVLTLFHMAAAVGWAEVMYRGMATTQIDYVPIKHNWDYWSLYFIFFMIVGSFFILNLFVGIVIATFNREKENLGQSSLLSDS